MTEKRIHLTHGMDYWLNLVGAYWDAETDDQIKWEKNLNRASVLTQKVANAQMAGENLFGHYWPAELAAGLECFARWGKRMNEAASQEGLPRILSEALLEDIILTSQRIGPTLYGIIREPSQKERVNYSLNPMLIPFIPNIYEIEKKFDLSGLDLDSIHSRIWAIKLTLSKDY